MKRDVATPEAYLDALEGESLRLVERIREVIRRIRPDGEEGVRYGMLDYPGLANLAAQKRYVALYVAPKALEAHRDRFPGVDAGKSCLRFKRLEQADPEALAALLEAVLAHRGKAGATSEDVSRR